MPATVNAVTGLPYIIVSPKKSWRGKAARFLAMKWYSWSLLGRRNHVVVQNPDDLEVLRGFTHRKLKTTMTRGSGVDLERFQPAPPRDNEPPGILFVGRLLREKGIYELIDAMRQLRETQQPIRLVVCGSVDGGNRSSVSQEECKQWLAEGIIDSIARVDDVRPHLAAADLVVLPSYREGTPRSLLEAMAVGRPIVTTDVPGCREVVEDDVNGVLVPAKDARSLADALRYMLDSPERLQRMGEASRVRAETEFDERQVIRANLGIYQSMIPGLAIPSDEESELRLPEEARQDATDSVVSG